MIRLGIKDPNITELKLPAQVAVFVDCANSSNCLKLEPNLKLEKRGNDVWLVRTKRAKSLNLHYC